MREAHSSIPRGLLVVGAAALLSALTAACSGSNASNQNQNQNNQDNANQNNAPVCGEVSGTAVLDDTREYDGTTWTATNPTITPRPPARSLAGGLAGGGRLWVFGGRLSTNGILGTNDLWFYEYRDGPTP